MDASGILSMYMEPPGADLTIEDFERFAIDRLRGEMPVCRVQCTDMLSTALHEQAIHKLNVVPSISTCPVYIPM